MMSIKKNDKVGKINRAPSVQSLEGQDLDWLIEQFVDDRRIVLDERTVNSYGSRLNRFFGWWEERGPRQNWQLTKTDFVEFERYLREEISRKTGRPLVWGYRRSIMLLLREIFHWAFTNGYTDNDYAAWVPMPQGFRRKRKAAGKAALLSLLDESSNSQHGQGPRDRTMIAMLIGMGLRRSEVSSVSVEEIVFRDDMSGHAHVYGKRTKASPTGERDAAFDSATGKIIAEHISAQKVTSGPLFRNKFGGRLSPSGVHQAVKRIIARANLDKEIQASHDLRRAFATHYVRDNSDPRAADMLRRQLGHSNYSMTAQYTLLDVEDLEKNITSPLTGGES